MRRPCAPMDEEAAFLLLEPRVAAASGGRLRLVNTRERGRCLVAARDLEPGCRIRDVPVALHGTARGAHLASVLRPQTGCGRPLPSGDLLAALDFLASLVRALAVESCEEEGAAWSLWALYRFPGGPRRVAVVRKWHREFQDEFRAVEVETIEAAWQHVVPNWRSLKTATPSGGWVESSDGSPEPVLAHENVCGLWMLMALCEHSCAPSCAIAHDGADLWLTVLRPLKAGDAITTSYLGMQGLAEPVESRRENLQEAWGFACSCPRCQLEASAGPEGGPACADDLRRLPALLERCCSPPAGAAGDELAAHCDGLDALCDLSRRLHPGAADPTTQSLLLMLALFAPEGERARRARRALQGACELLQGEGSPAARLAALLLEDPAALVRRAGEEARAAMAADGARPPPPAPECAGAGAAEAALRELYGRYLLSRGWPLRRVAPGGCWVPSAAAATAPRATGEATVEQSGEVKCFVSEHDSLSDTPPCDPTCMRTFASLLDAESLDDVGEVLEASLWGGTTPEPGRCHKVDLPDGAAVSCPCPPEPGAHAVDVRLDEVPWRRNADACTTVGLAEDLDGALWVRSPSWARGLAGEVELPCLYLAGSAVGPAAPDVLVVNADKAQVLSHLARLHQRAQACRAAGWALLLLACWLGCLRGCCWACCGQAAGKAEAAREPPGGGGVGGGGEAEARRAARMR
ncbi:unnamed protein product, partial [Prorocentrum cordatum]